MKFLKKKYERDIHFLCFIFFCFLLGAIKALVCLHIYAEKSQNIFFHLMRVYWYQIKVYLSFTMIKGLAKRTKSKQPSFWEIFAGIWNFMGEKAEGRTDKCKLCWHSDRWAGYWMFIFYLLRLLFSSQQCLSNIVVWTFS